LIQPPHRLENGDSHTHHHSFVKRYRLSTFFVLAYGLS
jgi:hypothetical protein